MTPSRFKVIKNNEGYPLVIRDYGKGTPTKKEIIALVEELGKRKLIYESPRVILLQSKGTSDKGELHRITTNYNLFSDGQMEPMIQEDNFFAPPMPRS